MSYHHIWNNINVTQRHPGPGLPAEVETYAYSGERLSSYTPGGSATPVSFTHDALGRITTDGLAGTQISYNVQDLPVSISRGDSIRVTFKYLSDGTKLEMTDSTGAGLLYRGPFIYRATATGPNGTTVRSLESVPFAGGRLTAGGTLRYVTDHLGSIRAVVNDAGSPLAIDEYEPYGAWRAVPGSDGVTAVSQTPAGVTLRYRFTGKEDLTPDWALPYTDFGARLYSPALRRWLSPDALSEKYYGINPYVHCAGNPVNLVDTDGNRLYFAKGVSESFKQRFSEAVSIMNEKGTSYNLAKLQASSIVFEITEGKNSYNLYTRTISWDPYHLTKDSETGIIISPLTSLAHEAGHAEGHNEAILQDNESTFLESTKKGSDPRFGSIEERRVTTKTEQYAARKHGEITENQVTRNKHSGSNQIVFSNIDVRNLSLKQLLKYTINENKKNRRDTDD